MKVVYKEPVNKPIERITVGHIDFILKSEGTAVGMRTTNSETEARGEFRYQFNKTDFKEVIEALTLFGKSHGWL